MHETILLANAVVLGDFKATVDGFWGAISPALKILSVIGVAVAGVCMLLGIADRRVLISTLFGVLIVFSAGPIVDLLASS